MSMWPDHTRFILYVFGSGKLLIDESSVCQNSQSICKMLWAIAAYSILYPHLDRLKLPIDSKTYYG